MHEWVNKYHMGTGPQKQFLKIGALKNFTIFIGKHLPVLESLFNKAVDLKKRLQHSRFLVNIAKFCLRFYQTNLFQRIDFGKKNLAKIQKLSLLQEKVGIPGT